MAKKCNLCKSTLSLMEGAQFTGGNKSSITLCTKCNETVMVMQSYSTDEKSYNEAYNYIQNHLSQYKHSDETIAIINQFLLKAEKRQVRARDALHQKKLRQELMSSLLTTTGYNFENYKIIKYYNIISSEVVIGTGFLSSLDASLADLTGSESESYSNKLDLARKKALNKLINKACDISANGIIGVDIDYINFKNDLIGVIISGTPVTIEKE